MENNLASVKIPVLNELSRQDLVFIVQHEALHRQVTYLRAAQMGEEVQALPVDHVALLEQSPSTIDVSRKLNNYASGIEGSIDTIADALLDLKMPLAETVETLTRYVLLRDQ